jgi:putative ABC transport system permease protein
MLKNYLKIAWRNLLKSKTFSLINITGLAVGLACFILISLFVWDELSYDRFNEKADRIYRINSDIRFGGNELKLAVSSDPLGATLKKDYPQVEEYVRFYNSSGSKLVKKGNEFINEAKVTHADSTLFDVFTLPALSGDTKNALNEPNSVVITESAAKKYFGTADATGRMLETRDDGSTLYKVTAVIKDLPHNSHFKFDFFFSMDNVKYPFGTYLSHNFQTYLLLKAGTRYQDIASAFPEVINKYVLPEAKMYMDISNMDEFKKAGNKLEYSLMPLLDIHLKSDRFPELGVNGSMDYVYIFSAVAIFILLLACINFMNLSTARSAGRAKEVGIRKVLGTEKKSLIQQFLAESVLMVLIALGISLLIIWLVLPWFNNMANKTLTLYDLFRPAFLPFLVLLPLVVGMIAGSYPAFFLSSFQPIVVLKGKLGTGFKKSSLRSMLVVFQFATSIILMIGTVIVYRQLNFIQTTKLGFNKDQLLIVDGTGALGANAQAFKNEILALPGVKSATYSGFLPVQPSSRNDYSFSKEAVMDMKSGFNQQIWEVDHEYIPVMGMELVKGRNFSREFGMDSSAIIINETTAGLLGYEDPIGKKLYKSNSGDGKMDQVYTIIGVVKNFHFESLRQNIGPLALRLAEHPYTCVFKVDSKNIRQLVSQVESKWKAMAPAMPFSYRFMDDSFDSMYRNEQRVGKVGLSFAMLAMLIACLGLFGLVTYMAEQRTKEIGVRKVLGASVNNIVGLMTRDFVKLVLISAVIAFPVSYLMMHRWLQDYAYRINMGWWVFMIAAVITVVIAFLTVSMQAIRAALANPVKSLRTE